MFVRKSTYLMVVRENNELHDEVVDLVAELEVQQDIAQKCAEKAVRLGQEVEALRRLSRKDKQLLKFSRRDTLFTRGELTRLVKYCHPDKHGGDPGAEEVTKKLLELRRMA